jgi:hypothetical protein
LAWGLSSATPPVRKNASSDVSMALRAVIIPIARASENTWRKGLARRGLILIFYRR